MANHTKRKLRDSEYYNKTSKRYEFHYTDKNGKKRVISSAKLEANDQLPKSKNQNVKSLREKEAEILKLLNSDLDVEAGKITVTECAYKFLDVLYAKKKIAYNTKESYKRICTTLSRTELGNLPIQRVKAEHCDKWFVDMCTNYSVSSVRTDLLFVKRIFEFAVDRDWIAKNPARSLSPEHNTKKRKPLNFETMQKFLDFVREDSRSQHCWQLIHVLFWTGLRVGELCALTIADLDFEKRLIYVNKQIQKEHGVRVVTQTKSANGNRIIPMPEHLVSVLQSQIEKRHVLTEPELQNEDGTRTYSGFVFLSTRRKTPMSKENVEQYMYNCVERYNKAHPNDKMDYCVPHVARHTFCTNMQQNNMNIVTLQHIMGHGSAKTTLDVYTGVKEPEKQVKEIDTIVTNMLSC